MIAGLPFRLASRPRFNASWSFFRVRHLLAVAADGFGDLHAKP